MPDLSSPCGHCGRSRKSHIGRAMGCPFGYGTVWNPDGEPDARLFPPAETARPITKDRSNLLVMYPADEYHEDYGTVIWWHLPVCEPPYVGSGQGMDERNADGYPTACNSLQQDGWLTHWSFLPDPKLMKIEEPKQHADAE